MKVELYCDGNVNQSFNGLMCEILRLAEERLTNVLEKVREYIEHLYIDIFCFVVEFCEFEEKSLSLDS